MFERISLRGVASYSSDSAVSVECNNKVNLIYGHNGSGKSTLATYLSDLSNEKFSACSYLSDGSELDVLVYNQCFIDEHFYTKDVQKGIFSLDKTNASAYKGLEKLEPKYEKIKVDLGELREKYRGCQSRIKKFEVEYLDKVWKEKSKYERSPLDFCLQGFRGNKRKFFDEILSVKSWDDVTSMDALLSEAGIISRDDVGLKVPFPPFNFDAHDIESNHILGERIVGATDSYLSSLIESLGSADWVNYGIRYVDISGDACPFCQQTIGAELRDDIKRLFDKAYEQKIASLNELLSKYEGSVVELKGRLHDKRLEIELGDNFKGFVHVRDMLIGIMDDNLTHLRKKVSNPSEPIKLNLSKDWMQGVNHFIDVANSSVNEFNDKIRNKEKVKASIVPRFWAQLRADLDIAFVAYIEGKNALKAERLEYEKQGKSKSDEEESVRKQMEALRAQTVNVGAAVDSINNTLAMIGIEGFSLTKIEGGEHYYRLTRPEGDSGSVYKTLSEGEKTLISFLYFLEYCKGTEEQKGIVNEKSRVIVVDDPISSLSHNHVYDVSVLIQRQLINRTLKGEFKQVFILTHSLFFSMKSLSFKLMLTN